MYLRSITVRNFMVHKETTLNLKPLNILIGPQGSGKSAFFDSLLNFSMLARGNLREAFGPFPYSFRATLHHGATKISQIGYRVHLSAAESTDEYLDYDIQYAHHGTDEIGGRFSISVEKLNCQNREGTRTLFDRACPEQFPGYCDLDLENDRAVLSSVRRAQTAASLPPGIDPLVVYCAQQVSRFNRFRLEPYLLSQPSAIPDVSTPAPSGEVGEVTPLALVPRLGYRGENLAATLFYLSETRSPELDRIRELLREVEPAFYDVEFNTVGPDRVGFSFVYNDARSTVPAVRLSSGILSYLGLIVLVSTPNRPPVLMIEEPENGLTAQAQKAFFGEAQRLAFAEPNARSQIFMSTHSPVLFAEAWNTLGDEVIQQFKVDAGRVVVGDVRAKSLAARGIQLGNPAHMGLKNAAEIMSGYLA